MSTPETTSGGGRDPTVLWPLALPLLAQVAVLAFGVGGSLGVFQAAAAAITFAGLGFALVPLGLRAWVVAAGVVALAAGGVHAVGVGFAGALPLTWLVFAVSTAGAGVACLGRGLTASRLGASVVAAALLVVGLTATFWADPIAATLPRAQRPRFVQACIHLDPLMACAYGVADHDRLHDADVYGGLPLASSLIERPTPLPTGLLWLAVGLLLGGAGLALENRRPE